MSFDGSGRPARLKLELEAYEALDAPSTEQVARANDVIRELAWLDREREREAAELLDEQERGRKQVERDRAEVAAAINRQRAERAGQERLLVEAGELRARADELEAQYRAGMSWSDAHAAAVAAAPPSTDEALRKMNALAAEAGIELTAGEKAGLIHKWRVGRMREGTR